jgi:hypothetical protein
MMQSNSDVAQLPRAVNLIGTWRRLGAGGPIYDTICAEHALPDDDRLMRIRVIETGEEGEHPLAEILEDPREN